jgi:putative membrane protein
MLTNLRLMSWAPALLLIGAACRNEDQPAGTHPTATPPNAPVQSGAPSERTGATPSATAPGAATGTTTAATPGSAAHTGQPSPNAGNAAASADTATPLTDGQIAAITDDLNTGEIEQAKVARSKSKNKDVLSFANMMIEHHGQAKKKQAALKESPEPSPLAKQLQSDSQKTLTQLNQANGSDFDRAYLDAQVEGHQKALDTVRQKLLPSAKTPELTKYLRDLQPTIEQHLTRARSLRDSLADNGSSAKNRSTTQPASMKQDSTSSSAPAPATKR